jgi:hypothetical protein
VDNRDPQREAETKKSVNKLVDAWCKRREASSGSNELAENDSTPNQSERSRHHGLKSRSTRSGRRANFPNQIFILLRRNHVDVYRNYPLLIAFLMQSVLTSIVVGLAFYDLQENPTDIQSLKTLTYQMVPIYFYLSK